MNDTAAFVIAGGRSSRMGRDKAFLTLDGRTLLERALALARGITQEVRIVGQRDKFAAYGDVVEDAYPGQGPLAGIHAALASSAAELNLIVGVDTPFLDPRFVHYLVEQARAGVATVTVPVTTAPIPHPRQNRSRVGQPTEVSAATEKPEFGTGTLTPHLDAGSPRLETGRSSGAQPLCAVYRREFATLAESALREGRNNIVPLFAQVTTREIGEDEMRQLAFDPGMFDNLNTPEEWDQACRRVEKRRRRDLKLET